MPMVDEAVRDDPRVYPPPNVREKLFPDLARSAASLRQMHTAWARFTMGKSAAQEPGAQLQIPAALHGTWARDEAACAVAEEIGSPDPGAVIDASSINRYENYCKVTRVRTRASDMVVADVTCNAEGETLSSSVTLILVDGKLRIDGAGDYVPCPVSPKR
jgi:hypothetical protein